MSYLLGLHGEYRNRITAGWLVQHDRHHDGGEYQFNG